VTVVTLSSKITHKNTMQLIVSTGFG
jgi:hypothetical protein